MDDPADCDDQADQWIRLRGFRLYQCVLRGERTGYGLLPAGRHGSATEEHRGHPNQSRLCQRVCLGPGRGLGDSMLKGMRDIFALQAFLMADLV